VARYPRRSAAKADTRRRLVQSALKLFQRDGYDATRVDDIAALAGVTKRTFFVHFPTKADILFDVPTEELERMSALILAQPPGDSDLLVLEAAVLEFSQHSLEHLRTRHRLVRLLLRAAATSPEIRGRQLDYNQMMVDNAGRALAHRRGRRTPSLKALTASRAVFRVHHEIIIEWANRRPEDLTKIAQSHFAALNSLLSKD
jgi:TetR/AcrR family transcriptional regulator, regulator of mycofactocin system